MYTCIWSQYILHFDELFYNNSKKTHAKTLKTLTTECPSIYLRFYKLKYINTEKKKSVSLPSCQMPQE